MNDRKDRTLRLRDDPRLKQALIDKGVVIHAPEATLVADLDPARIEPGVEIYPGSSLVGAETLIGAGSRIGRAGGGWFENLRCGRQVDLFGGFYQDCVLLDEVRIRGHAELRSGTLLEEGCGAAQHAGFKMTVMLPFVKAGSHVNLADALVAGGSGPHDFSEIGSVFALYNYSPQDDKWPSRFGDVPSGVFLRERRIFIGGQSQIVSPVHVGYGAVIAAGGAVRQDVPAGRLYAEAPPALDRDFDARAYGPLGRKLELTIEHVGNLRALEAWYQAVRQPLAEGDRQLEALYAAAASQLAAGAAERIQRLDRLVAKLPRSARAHRRALEACDGARRRTWLGARLAEHEAIERAWPHLRSALSRPLRVDASALAPVTQPLGRSVAAGERYVDAIRALEPEPIAQGRAILQGLIDALVGECERLAPRISD